MTNSGAVKPRDKKEEIIFAYFQAIQEARYEDAHNLTTLSPSIPYDRFYRRISKKLDSIPSVISIKSKDSIEDEYIYEVYMAIPNSSVLRSGMVSLVLEERDGQKTWLINYNSAF